MNIPSFINRLNSNTRLVISLSVAIAVGIYLYGKGSPAVHWMITWITFCVVQLCFGWVTILTCRPTDEPNLAKKQDAGRMVSFIFILIATLASLLTIVLLFQSTKDLKDADLRMHIILTISSVFFTWWLLHTNFTFKYAHLYYTYENGKKDDSSKGLDFPGDMIPDYLDFTYFSFVIGSTFQVSDVAICSRQIRRVAWLHGMLSFGFNTIIVALTINIISGLVK